MRRATRLFSLFMTACLITGCEPPPPSQQELGRIIFNESEVPGANETYEIPEYLRKAIPDQAAEERRRMPGE